MYDSCCDVMPAIWDNGKGFTGQVQTMASPHSMHGHLFILLESGKKTKKMTARKLITSPSLLHTHPHKCRHIFLTKKGKKNIYV